MQFRIQQANVVVEPVKVVRDFSLRGRLMKRRQNRRQCTYSDARRCFTIQSEDLTVGCQGKLRAKLRRMPERSSLNSGTVSGDGSASHVPLREPSRDGDSAAFESISSGSSRLAFQTFQRIAHPGATIARDFHLPQCSRSPVPRFCRPFER